MKFINKYFKQKMFLNGSDIENSFYKTLVFKMYAPVGEKKKARISGPFLRFCVPGNKYYSPLIKRTQH